MLTPVRQSYWLPLIMMGKPSLSAKLSENRTQNATFSKSKMASPSCVTTHPNNHVFAYKKLDGHGAYIALAKNWTSLWAFKFLNG